MNKLDIKLEKLFESKLNLYSDIDDLYNQYYKIKNRLDEINQEYYNLDDWKKYYNSGDLKSALFILQQIEALDNKYTKEIHDLKIDLELLVIAIETKSKRK